MALLKVITFLQAIFSIVGKRTTTQNGCQLESCKLVRIHPIVNRTELRVHLLFQIPYNSLSSIESFHALISLASIAVNFSIISENIYHLQIVSLSHLKIIWVMRWCDLQRNRILTSLNSHVAEELGKAHRWQETLAFKSACWYSDFPTKAGKQTSACTV